MKIRVTYRDNEPVSEYEHVHKIALSPNGLAYHLVSINNAIISIVPLDVIRKIEDPDADTEIAVVQSKVTLE